MASRRKIIIEGITRSGERLRPSDWAERLSESLSEFEPKKHRITYSPLLQPIMRGGEKCVRLDPKLKGSNPNLYYSILEFAHKNKLRICKEEEDNN